MYAKTGTERARNDIAEAFFQFELSPNMEAMVATSVLPVMPVMEAHGTYPLIEVKELSKTPVAAGNVAAGFAAQRAPKSAYLRDDLAFTQATYNTEEHGLEGTVDENEAAHYRNHFEHEVVTAEWTLHRLMVQRELRTARALFNTTTFPVTTPTSYDASNQLAGTYRDVEADNAVVANALTWDKTASTPVQDIAVAKYKVWLRTGVFADAMVINEKSWNLLRRNDEIRQQVMALGSGTQALQRDLTRAQVAAVLDIGDIHVAGASEDKNNGNPAVAYEAQHIWGSGALVYKQIRTSSMREIGLGHTLHWTADGSVMPAFIEDYNEVQTRSQIVRVRHQDRQLIKYSNCGEFITSTY